MNGSDKVLVGCILISIIANQQLLMIFGSPTLEVWFLAGFVFGIRSYKDLATTSLGDLGPMCSSKEERKVVGDRRNIETRRG